MASYNGAMDMFSADQYFWARLIFERSLGAIYFVAFLSAYNQFPALLGEKGLLPAPIYLAQVSFRQTPSLFHLGYSDFLLRSICFIGMVISLLFVTGSMSDIPILVHILSWLTLYFLYLSIVNVGQVFYGFGWETMLLEVGFFAAFMGPQWLTPSWIPILILRWMLFRTEMGAGLIKLRGDKCWKDLTCLYFHHETQPLPNPLSRSFHHLPKAFHRFGVVFSHFCQLVAPIGIFLPWPVAPIAGFFLIVHQLILIVSGNYSWLNWLTIVLGFLCFPAPTEYFVSTAARPMWFEISQYIVLSLSAFLSYRPLLNLFSKNQYMNFCWNVWHLVGAYGAFGSVTKERYEIVIEGTTDEIVTANSKWREYGFRGKPVELDRLPPVVAPYHLRLDWMIWFLPFSVVVGRDGIYVRGHDIWFARFLKKLLQNDKALLRLFRFNPFLNDKPKWIRAQFYLYQFTTKEEKSISGDIWKRKMLGEYCPAISLEDLSNIE